MKKQTAILLLLVIIAAGVGLRSWQLTARSLWFDEAFSWRLMQFPFHEMLNRIARDVHPPLYYLLLRAWTNVFESSTLALRSFSVFWAGVTIAAAYGFTAYATSSRRAGLTAAALLAVSGWQISFAWEARMYTLGTAFALLSSWLLLRGVRRPTPWVWLAYSAVATAFAYTHYFAFFTLAAHGLFVLGMLVVQTRGRIGEMIQAPLFLLAAPAAVLAIVLYAPWIPVLLHQNGQVQQAFWVPAPDRWSIPDTAYHLLRPTVHALPRSGIGLFGTLMPLVAASLLYILLLIAPRQRDTGILTALCGVVPFVLAISTSFVGHSLYQDRYLVFAGVFLWIGLAMLLEYLPSWWRRISTVAVVLLLFAGYAGYWRELDIPHKGGVQAATAYVAAQRQTSEPLIVTSPFIYFSVDHYLQETFKQPGQAKLYSETGELIHFAGGPILRHEDVIGPAGLAGGGSVWIIDTTGFGGSKLALPAPWHTVDEKSFPEVFGYQGEVFVTKYVR